MKFFLVPGIAKAGTTFLYDQVALFDQFFNLPRIKEITYFSKQNQTLSLDQYLRQFKSKDVNKFFVDVSPVYLRAGRSSATNAARILGEHEVKVLILIRNPIDYVFSHYLHDIKAAVCRFRNFGKYQSYSFFDFNVLNRYLWRKSDSISGFLEAFGENVLGMHMNALFEADASSTIGRFLNLDLPAFQTGSVSNPGGWLPYYVYGGADGASYFQDGVCYEVPPKTLVLVSNDRSDIKTDVAQDEAEFFMRLSNSFSRHLEIPSKTEKALIEDYHLCCNLLKLTPRPVEEGVKFLPSIPKLSRQILDKLRVAR